MNWPFLREQKSRGQPTLSYVQNRKTDDFYFFRNGLPRAGNRPWKWRRKWLFLGAPDIFFSTNEKKKKKRIKKTRLKKKKKKKKRQGGRRRRKNHIAGNPSGEEQRHAHHRKGNPLEHAIDFYMPS